MPGRIAGVWGRVREWAENDPELAVLAGVGAVAAGCVVALVWIGLATGEWGAIAVAVGAGLIGAFIGGGGRR